MIGIIVGATSVSCALSQETDGIVAKCNKTGTMNLFSMEVGWGGDCFRQDCLASLIAYCTIHNLEWYAITNITSINPLF